MNALPKYKKTASRNKVIRPRTPTSKVRIGDWALEQDEGGRLIIQHVSGESYVLGTPPEEVTDA